MGLLSRFFRRSETSPISNPAPWVYEMLGASASNSGVSVNRDKALTYSAVWAAVNLIASSVASMPLHTMRRIDGKGKERDTSHPLFRTLRYQANPEMTAFTFRRCLEAHRLLHGNGYALIDRDGGELNLWPIDPLQVQPDRDRATRRLFYRITTPDAGTVELDQNDVLHIRGLSGDGIQGYSVLRSARNSIGGALARSEFSERFFANNAVPNTILKVPASLNKEAKEEFLERWNKQQSGLKNSSKVGLLNQDFEIQTLGIPAKDAQLIEAMDWSIRDVANWFNIPPGMIGDVSRSAYNALGQDQQLYLNVCLDPILTNWEAELRAKLLSDDEAADDAIVIEFERRALLQMEPEAQARVFQTGINAGWLLKNEVRAMLNLPPTEGGDKPKAPPQPIASSNSDDAAKNVNNGS